MSNERYNAIEMLAYLLWDSRGRPEGSAEEDWHEAERQFLAARESSTKSADVLDEAVAESFPASDPPATEIRDQPPSNAEDKWRAAGVAREERKPARAEKKSQEPST